MTRDEFTLYEGKTMYCFKDENGEERRFVTRAFAEKQANGREIYTTVYHQKREHDNWDDLSELMQELPQDEIEAVTRQFLPKTDQRRYRMEWDRANTKQIKMKLNLKTDADILEKLESVPNKQGYIKELIRKDLEK